MEYWSREGKPAEPDDLRQHHCLVIRNASGVLLDRWIFERNGERQTIDVRSRLFTDDTNWLLDATCAGAGVVRLLDITYNRFLSSGPLVPVLTDWEAIEAPIVYAAYRPKLRHSRLVRAFLHYLVEVFSELERASVGAIPRVPKPEWFGRARGRQSTYVARGKKPG
jgi:DNA-binding transcriptional LysR family regulator